MSTTTSGSNSGDEAEEHNVDDAPTVMLGAASDRCSRCGAPLAVDQRYCVECGTRRGRPRFLLTPAPGSADPVSGGIVGPTTWRGRIGTLTSSSTLLLGILVLLLAVGVGVLIGDHNSSDSGRTPKVTANFYQGGSSAGSSNASSGAAATSGTSGTSGSSSSSSSSSTAGKSSKTKSTSKSSKTKTTATKAKTTAVNTNVSAGGVSKAQNKASTIGGKCTAGTAGCQNGVETGNFF